jgi:hypothetical protein
MATARDIDWSDLGAAAKQLAGNWRDYDCFAWSRGYDLDDADKWCIWYTSSRDSGLLERSNEKAINERLRPFSQGDEPDLVFETHSHWAVGYLDGFSLRVFRPDGTVTPAFQEFCCIKQALEAYPILNEQDYSDMEWQATLENYANEMWQERKELPEGWEGEVYCWFSNNCMDEFIENRDDRGGWAPKERISEALQALGLMSSVVVVENSVVQNEG